MKNIHQRITDRTYQLSQNIDRKDRITNLRYIAFLWLKR
jgi:hypothetical protein